MTDTQPQHQGAIGAVTDFGAKLVTALPPSFVILVLLNIAFLGTVLWWIDSQTELRNRAVGSFVDRCMAVALKNDTLGAVEARLDALEHDVRTIEAKR